MTPDSRKIVTHQEDILIEGRCPNAIGGWPQCRICDRIQDLKDLGHDVDTPAAI